MIDLAIIGLVAFCAWRGYKNGLIRGVFGIVSLVVALIIANAAAQAYAKEAKPILMPFAAGLVDSTLIELEENNIEYQPLAHDHERSDEAFGLAYVALRQIGFPEAASVSLAEKVADDPLSYLDATSYIESLAEKITDTLSFVAVFGIAFMIVAIVFAVIGNLVGFVFSLPGLKQIDIIAGAAFGLVKGVIIALVIAVILKYFGLFSASIIEGTALLEYLTGSNIIANIIGL